MQASELITELQRLIRQHGDCRIDIETGYNVDPAMSIEFVECDQYGDAITIRAED